MEAFQQRVVDEKQALDEKIEKLTFFTATDIYAQLPEQERRLLKQQLSIMECYSFILGERIKLFKS